MNKLYGQAREKCLLALTICLILALLGIILIVAFTDARFVTEIDGDNSLPYETQTPFNVDSQNALINAIKSGYGYVKLDSDLRGPIIMSGEQLDMKRDLTIDLNGKEIQRTSTDALLTITEGTSLSIIDTSVDGGGGLYNPVGSVLTVGGGNLNVYGGMFESGPRPTEYYTNLHNKEGYEPVKRMVNMIKQNYSDAPQDEDFRAALPIRGSSSMSPDTGSVYFDVTWNRIKADTYCYTVVKGETNDDFSTFDTNAATFAYTYYVDTDGQYVGYVNTAGKFMVPSDDTGANYAEAALDESYREVMVFAFENDILRSVARADNGDAQTPDGKAPNYAAVQMRSGTLNVEVQGASSADVSVDNRISGSFYSYFGTWQTYCIYISGGTMNVSTTGEIKTVDPTDLPAKQDTDTNVNSAKFSEGACIFSESVDLGGGNYSSGTLNLNKLHSATSYNGSVISVSGGDVTFRDANITKNMTLSHSDDPFGIADGDAPSDGATGSEFPTDRQYRDAAVFINGGSLTLLGSDMGSRRKSINIEVFKDITDGYRTSFGILSRGRQGTVSQFDGEHVAIQMHNSNSYGVFGTRGRINLNSSSISLDSDSYCYGVYAVNKTSVKENKVNINLVETNISILNANAANGNYFYQGVDPTNTSWVDSDNNALSNKTANAMRAASIGVYLDSHEFQDEDGLGGSVTLDNSTIVSQELGVSVYGGNLTFKNGGGITAHNASAITLREGNIDFEAGGEYAIDCKINRQLGEHSACALSKTNDYAIKPGQHQYKIFLPYQRETDAQGNVHITEYANENGIRVMGGTLTSRGKITMKFQGLYNDLSSFEYTQTDSSTYDNFRHVTIKSFAIACIQAEGVVSGSSAARIEIDYANIESTVGGGIKVQGGEIILGNSSSTRDDIVVTTKGNKHTSEAYRSVGNYSANGWNFQPSLSGGHAVIARGGSLTVYNGTFEAAYSNAAAVTADDNSTPTITIHDGKFVGNRNHNTGSTSVYASSGPMSYYGIKVVGKSNVYINGGEFNGHNGGLFITGTDTSSANKAYLYITAGTFGTPDGVAMQDIGQDGVNIYDYTEAYFGSLSDTSAKIKIYANLFPIAVNSYQVWQDKATAYRPVVNSATRVYVYSGEYYIRDSGTNTVRGLGSISASHSEFHIYNFNYGGTSAAPTKLFRSNGSNAIQVTASSSTISDKFVRVTMNPNTNTVTCS